MARENIHQATEWILGYEGGYVDHPDDPGGATNYGVTQAVYDRWRAGRASQSVAHIGQDEVIAIYKQGYWDKTAGDILPSGVDFAVYDFAVHSGPGRAVRFLQRRLGVEEDGILGPLSMAAVWKVQENGDVRALIEEYCSDRLAWLQTLRTFPAFGRGWSARIDDRETGVGVRAKSLVRDEQGPAIPGQGMP